MPTPLRPPIGFAHRGASAHAPANTLEAFALALRLGATGLESDAWITADGVVVLDHDGVVGPRWRRRAVAELCRADLPPHIPSLEELWAACGTGFDLSLDVKDLAAAPSVIAAATAAGATVTHRLWLCHPDIEVVAGWRELSADVRLVDSTRMRRVREGAERRAARLAELGIDAVNLPVTDWSGGLRTLFHRFERLAFAWDAHHRRQLDEVLTMGVDAVYSNHVDRMVDALAAQAGR